jgi:hypothetical protein
MNSDEKTVVIYARYFRTANRKAIHIAVQSAQDLIEKSAKGFGWEDWVRVQEHIRGAN